MGPNSEVMTRKEARDFLDRCAALIQETMDRLADDIAGIVPEEHAEAGRKIVEDLKVKLLEDSKQSRRELLGPE